MYAIIQNGCHQTKVMPGGFVTIDGVVGSRGDQLAIENVLLVEKDGGDIVVGSPFITNARVVAVVDGEARGPKIRVFKKKRRKGERNTKGHRAIYTRARVTEIVI